MSPWELIVEPKNTTQWPQQRSNPDRSIQSPTRQSPMSFIGAKGLKSNLFSFFSYLLFQYYVVSIECPACSDFQTNNSKVSNTSFSQELPCGNEYIFTVRASDTLQNGAESHVAISLNSPVGPVTHLTVQFIPGNGTADRIVHDNFLLKWDPPKDAASSGFKVLGT